MDLQGSFTTPLMQQEVPFCLSFSIWFPSIFDWNLVFVSCPHAEVCFSVKHYETSRPPSESSQTAVLLHHGCGVSLHFATLLFRSQVAHVMAINDAQQIN